MYRRHTWKQWYTYHVERLHNGLVASVFALENDLYTHLENAKVVLDQAAVDATPYVEEAIANLEVAIEEAKNELTVLASELLVAAEEFAYATVDYILTNLDDIYYSIPGVAADVFETVLEMAIVVDVFVGDLVEDTVEFVLATYVWQSALDS